MSKRVEVAGGVPKLEGWGRVALPVLLSASLLAIPAIGQDRSSKREVKRQLNEATEALARGDLRAAQKLYRALAGQVPAGDERRAEVLYGVSLSHVLSPAGTEDRATGRAALQELATLAAAPHEQERTALIQLLDALDSLDAQTAETRRAKQAAKGVQSQLSALEQRQRHLEAEAAAEAATGAGERDELESQLATANETIAALTKELATTRADLENKEKILEQLRQKLVGNG